MAKKTKEQEIENKDFVSEENTTNFSIRNLLKDERTRTITALIFLLFSFFSLSLSLALPRHLLTTAVFIHSSQELRRPEFCSNIKTSLSSLFIRRPFRENLRKFIGQRR